MRLSSPTKKVFNAAMIIAIIAVIAFIVGFFALEAVLPIVAFALMLIAFALLAMGAALKGF
jgi:hypothetical protein